MSLFGPPDIQKLQAKNNIGGLIKALSYTKDSSIPPKAIFALGATKNPKAVDALITVMAQDDPDLRAFAIDELGGMGDLRAFQPILRALDDKNLYVKSQAAKALGELGDKGAVNALVDMLDDIPRKVSACKGMSDFNAAQQRLSGIRQLSMNAAASLEKLGWQPDNSVAAVVYFIESGNWDHIIEIGDPAVETLRIFFHVDSSEYCYPNRGSELTDAVKVLGRIGSEHSILLLLDIQKVRDLKEYELFRTKTRNEIDSISCHVETSLYEAAKSNAAPFKSALFDLHSSGFYLFRAITRIIQGLEQNSSDDAKAILASLLSHASSEISLPAACALAGLGDMRAEPILVDFLKKSSNGMNLKRDYVITALGSLGAVQTVPVLVDIISQELRRGEGVHEQQKAARELEKIGWIPETVTIDVSIRYYLFSGQIDKCIAVGVPSIEPLIALLKTPLRTDAASALEKAGAASVEPLCGAIMKSSQAASGFIPATLPSGASLVSEHWYWDEVSARHEMVRILGRIGDSRAIETLTWIAHHDRYVVNKLEYEEIAAQDLEWPIRESAVEALTVISSRS